MAHRGDEIAVAAGLDTKHAEAGLGIVEGDPLDEAGQHLAAGCCASSASLAGGGAVAVVSGRVRASVHGCGLSSAPVGAKSLPRRPYVALLHESSLARTMPTDRILTDRRDMTLVGPALSSD